MSVKKILTKILALLAIMQFCAVAYVNFTMSYDLLDMDASLAMRHATEMWKHGLFLKEFAYVTSMEIDAATFFAAPIYLLIGNLNIALGITHSILYLLIVWLLYDISRNLSVNVGKNGFLLSVLLCFTPYASKPGYLDWSNMLFFCGGQYEFRVICMLSALDVVLLCEKKTVSRLKFGLSIAFCCMVNFWTSLSTGNFVLLMVLLPFVMKIVLETIMRQKIELKERSIWCICLLCIVCIAAMEIRERLNIGSHRSDLPLIGASNFWLNLQNAIVGIFLLFGGLVRGGDTMLFSVEGISTLARFGLVLVCFGVACWELKVRKNKTTVFLYFCMSMLLNLGLYSVTNSLYGSDIFEHRYHILWCYMLLIVVAYAVNEEEAWKNKYLQKILSWGIMLLVILINVTGFKEISTFKDGKGYEERILELAEERDVDHIIMYNNSGSMFSLQAMDPERTTVSFIYYDGQMVADGLDSYYYTGENTYSGGKHLFLCAVWDFDKLPEYVKSTYTLIDDSIVAAGSGHNVYYAEESVWDGVSGLPASALDSAVDFAYSKGYSHKGEINSQGQLAAKSTEDEFVLWGPFANAVPGLYDITVEYHVVQEGRTHAFFDICADPKNVVLRQVLPAGQDSITLNSVSITGSAPLEFRIWQSAGGEIIFDRIIFERVE